MINLEQVSMGWSFVKHRENIAHLRDDDIIIAMASVQKLAARDPATPPRVAKMLSSWPSDGLEAPSGCIVVPLDNTLADDGDREWLASALQTVAEQFEANPDLASLESLTLLVGPDAGFIRGRDHEELAYVCRRICGVIAQASP
ncbi:MAG: hypothetical protein AAF805_13650 [Planctomycetota bacterium]